MGGSLWDPHRLFRANTTALQRLKQTPERTGARIQSFSQMPRRTFSGAELNIRSKSIHPIIRCVGLTLGAKYLQFCCHTSTGSAGSVAMALHLLRRVTHAGARASVNHQEERSYSARMQVFGRLQNRMVHPRSVLLPEEFHMAQFF